MNPGDRVVYVPEQNVGDNIHHDAIFVCFRGPLYVIDVIGGKRVTVSRKRILIGQGDAFQTDQDNRA